MYNYKPREIHRIMKKNGFYLDHYTGSHAIYKNDKGRHISVGLCKCNGMIMRRLIKENNLNLTV